MGMGMGKKMKMKRKRKIKRKTTGARYGIREGHGRLCECRRKKKDHAAGTRRGKRPTRWVVLPRPAPHLRRRARQSWQSLWQSSLLRAAPSGDTPIGLISVRLWCRKAMMSTRKQANGRRVTAHKKTARWAPSRSMRSPELFIYHLHRRSARYRHSPGL